MSGTGRGSSAIETRTVVVEPLSSRREAALVARAVFHILFWSMVLIGLERGDDSQALRLDVPSATPSSRVSAAVGEVNTAELDTHDQMLFREIDAAIGAMERVRSDTGAWPTVAELSTRGVPPFTTSSPGYRWRMLHENMVTNYVGLPDAPDSRPTFAIVLVEPEPEIPVDPRAIPDEIHHKLADGTMLHASIWKAPGSRDVEQPLAAPAPEDGWLRITSKPR